MIVKSSECCGCPNFPYSLCDPCHRHNYEADVSKQKGSRVDSRSVAMHETQRTISEWGFKTFGYPKDAIVIVKRMLKEVKELEEVIKNDATYDMIADECADIHIVMCQVFATMGYNFQSCVDHKMQINRARKWKIAGDGTGQHVKE